MTTLPAGWKPISSAPKDGTPVLAFWTGGTEAATVYGRSYGITMFKRGEWVNVDNCDDTYSEPTHWMPLPAAPGAPPATTQDAPITVSLDPDPRGISVGVWQGSRCIYNGAHAVPSAQDDAKDEQPYCYALETRGRHGDKNDVLLDVEYNRTDNFSGGRTGGIPLYRRPSGYGAVREKLHAFLDAAAGEGLILGDVDAQELCIEVFPDRYAASQQQEG